MKFITLGYVLTVGLREIHEDGWGNEWVLERLQKENEKKVPKSLNFYGSIFFSYIKQLN